jgi:thioredoxin 1
MGFGDESMSAVLEVSQSDFDQKAMKAEGLVLVDFSAKWCGPCKRMLPELEAAAEELKGKATFIKVDVDEAPDIALQFGVQGIPNLTFLKGGKVVDVVVGAIGKPAILARVRQNL